MTVAANEVALIGLTITGGVGYYGGGVFNSSGTLTVTDSTISGNSTSGYDGGGGGIFNSGALTVTNSTISGNLASRGGGICNSGTLTVINSIISGNSNDEDSGGAGGGVYNTGTLTVINSTIADNLVVESHGWGGFGGGIYNDNYGTATVTNSTISGNSASGYDGGGGTFNSGTLTVTNSTISGNATGWQGGGIYNGSRIFDDGPAILTVINSTIAGNSAGWEGGGIYNSYPGTLKVANSIIALNTASSGPNVSGSLAVGSGFNLIGVDPLFVRNPTSGDPGDLHLLPGSPAINKGSNALAVDADGNPLVTDLDGKDRIIYGTVDIGAYEYRLAGDANLDGVVNDRDASILGAHWQMPAGATWAMGDFNGDGKVDDRDAAIMAAHWGQQATEAAESPPQLGNAPTPTALLGPRPASSVPATRRRLSDPREAARQAAREAAFAEASGYSPSRKSVWRRLGPMKWRGRMPGNA